jgi:indole-3-glycerol phosphate synthase
LSELEQVIDYTIAQVRPFKEALDAKVESGDVALITEIKKASPSKGIIRENFNPKEIAESYQAAGATCLSVLTDRKYFQGENYFIKDVKGVVDLPVLRKDFMLDPYQIYESRALGADCILLIMAALSDAQAKELESVAIELGMDVLVETHNEKEIERALELESRLIGINNRDLVSLEIDIAVTERLIGMLPSGTTIVSESGIREACDIARLSAKGAHCFLVGTSLMEQADIGRAVEKLIGLE